MRCGCAGGGCSCFLAAGSNVTITGNGSAGNPFTISSAEIGLTTVNTTSITLVLAGSVLSAAVKLDPTAGNLLASTAGGLRLDCAAIAACGSSSHVEVGDSSTIDMSISGDGSIGTPYVISGVVIPGPGLAVSGGGLIPDVGGSAWPWGCPDTSGAPVYVDGGGALVVDPPSTAQVAGADVTGGTTPGSTAVPGGDTAIDTASIAITNPSACRAAVVLLTYTVNVTYTLGAGNGIVVTVGGVDLLVDVPSGTRTGVTTAVTYTTQGALSAGATTTFSEIISARQAGTAGATYSATAWRANYLLVTT